MLTTDIYWYPCISVAFGLCRCHPVGGNCNHQAVKQHGFKGQKYMCLVKYRSSHTTLVNHFLDASWTVCDTDSSVGLSDRLRMFKEQHTAHISCIDRKIIRSTEGLWFLINSEVYTAQSWPAPMIFMASSSHHFIVWYDHSACVQTTQHPFSLPRCFFNNMIQTNFG